MKNKLAYIIISAALTFSFTACGQAAAPADNAPAQAEETADKETDSVAAEDVKEDTVKEPVNDEAEETADNSLAAPSDIYAEISDSISLVNPVEMTDDFLENYYGVDLAMLDSYVCYMSEDATSAETILIMQVSDSANIDAVSECVDMVRSDKLAEMEDYLPEQFAIVEKSSVNSDDNYVWLVISENAGEIEKIISKNIKGN